MLSEKSPATARGTVLLAAVALGLGLVACVSTGPQTIARDRFDYGAAIADSSREQLLLNIVRLRYLEAPVFLEVPGGAELAENRIRLQWDVSF